MSELDRIRNAGRCFMCEEQQLESALEKAVESLEYTEKELRKHKFYEGQGRLLTAVKQALAEAKRVMRKGDQP